MKRFKKILLWLLVILIPVIICAYVFIPKIIRSEIHKKAQSYGFNIDFDSIDIDINQVVLNRVSISSTFFPNQHATLDKIIVKIDWFTPKSVSIDGGNVNLKGTPNSLKQQLSNWSNRGNGRHNSSNTETSLLNRVSVEGISLIWDGWRSTSELKAHGIGLKNGIITAETVDTRMAGRLIQVDKVKYDLDKPIELYIGTIRVTPIKSDEEKGTSKLNLKIPNIPKVLESIRVHIEKSLITHENHIIQTKQTRITFNHGDLIGINLVAEEININEVYLDQLYATLTSNATGQLNVWIDASAKALRFAHQTLLNQKVEIKNPGINFQIVVDPNRFELQEGRIRINKVSFNVSGSYDSEWIRGKVQMPRIRCQDLLDSIPLAMKPTINGMKLEGDMSWEIHGDVDIPDKSNTSIRVKLKNGCKVVSVPDAISIARLRKPFKRYVYDANNELVEIENGPGIPGWTPIALTSMFIPIAVRTMEDPSFMAHRGFDIQAIENSIRDNIKEGRFAKGASTISMQLAKNLWLNRDKTISRKVQEAFLTIYLEQKLRKDEILELYINVVEFGPDLYGIGKASLHYFKKHSANLTLGQAMFLMSILPKPKNYYFDANGGLTPGKLKFLHRAMKAMRDRKIISEDEYQQGIREVITFGQSSTEAETEEIVIGEDGGISPDSWDTTD